MSTLACVTHWYTSALYVVPVLFVGGWGWWSAKRMTRHQAHEGPSAAAGGPEPGGMSDHPAY